MITTSETITAIAKAISEASPNIASAQKDAKNPHFRSDYATLESAIKASKTALSEVGVFVMQSPGKIEEGCIRMNTRLIHSSGEWLETVCDVPLQKRDAQGVGSAITYGRRYALMAALNIPATDDDGNDAVRPPEKRKPRADVAPDDRLDFTDICDRPANVEQLNAAKSRELFSTLKGVIEFCAVPEQLQEFATDNAGEIYRLSDTAQHYLREAYDARLEQLMIERSAA